jgi:hypothetical protein
MIIDILQICLFIGVSYLFYEKVFKMYYWYYHYSKLGIPSTGFPLPIFGTVLKA